MVFARQISVGAAGDLLFNLVRAELTARYKTATFGLLWFLLSPALQTAVLLVVFQGVIQLSIRRYPVFLLAAMLPWTYFQMALSSAVVSLTRSPGLVKRVRIPRVLVPLSAVLASLVHFAVSLGLFLAALAALGLAPGLGPTLALVPIVLVETLCIAGLGIGAAALNVLYRDVEHLIGMALRLGFWVTPIFYPLEYVPERWRPIAMLNPLTGLLESYRDVLARHQVPPLGSVGVATALSIVSFGIGLAIFRWLDPHLDDHV